MRSMETSAETSAHCHISSNITNNCYHQRSSEKFVLHLIYNVFIAPFYTVLATCGVFFFYLAAAFFVGFFGFKWVHYWCVYSALKISYDYEMHLAIAVSAVICAIFSTFLASTDKVVIGSSTALIATIGGLLTMRLEKAPELGLAIGTVLSVFIYWFYLESEQQTVKDIVAKNYLKISFLNERRAGKKSSMVRTRRTAVVHSEETTKQPRSLRTSKATAAAIEARFAKNKQQDEVYAKFREVFPTMDVEKIIAADLKGENKKACGLFCEEFKDSVA